MTTENVNLQALKIDANVCYIYLYPLRGDCYSQYSPAEG